jgi:hypothetical protein
VAIESVTIKYALLTIEEEAKYFAGMMGRIMKRL